jgi:ketosteroid isomerase-like protein
VAKWCSRFAAAAQPLDESVTWRALTDHPCPSRRAIRSKGSYQRHSCHSRSCYLVSRWDEPQVGRRQPQVWGTDMATQHTVEEGEIRAQIDKLAEAIRGADLEGVKLRYAPDVVSFDVGPRLQDVGAEAKWNNWIAVFTLFQRPIGVEVRDITITVGGDVAFGHSFNLLSGTLKNGTRSGGFWVRATYCFRKIDGNWLIVHDHASAPMDPGSGKALLNLEP